jgi:hypothetical protein
VDPGVTRPTSVRYGTWHGLNLDDLEHTTQQEIDTFLSWARANHTQLYYMTSHSVWLENRPDMAKLHHRLLPEFRRNLPEAVFMLSIDQLHTYIFLDWEIGITSEFKVLQEQGLSKAQLMEIVMAAQIYAGIRGLEAVYRATWPFIRDFRDRPEPARFPAGWAPDPTAFKAGLDEPTTAFTNQDRQALDDWYLRNGGEVPKWVRFMAKHRPEFLKAYRLRWEGIFRGALPKQCIPFMMMYHSMVNGYADGLREVALLGRSWGLTKDWLLLAIIGAAYYYTGFEGMNMVEDAIGDILE